jgi:hypothetical protein
VGFGLAASHARPGGNVTGVLLTVEDLPTKLLTLARELLPDAHKIGLLVNPTNPIQPFFRGTLEAAAAALGDELIVIEVGSRDDLHPAFQRFTREGAKILVLPQDLMFLNERKRIALFAIAERGPPGIKIGSEYYKPLRDAIERCKAKATREAACKAQRNKIPNYTVKANGHGYWQPSATSRFLGFTSVAGRKRVVVAENTTREAA